MKPISKTFDFSGGKTIKVRTDGRYEWCGKLLGRDECVVLDAALLLPDSTYGGGIELRQAIRQLFGQRCFNVGTWCPYGVFEKSEQAARWVRHHWVWIKGS